MAMARSFNYTKRQDIANSSVRVTVSGVESHHEFAAAFNLKEYDFDSGAKLYVEAYRKNQLKRFDFGTVGAIVSPESTSLDEFGDDVTGVRFRVKVVAATAEKTILGMSRSSFRAENDEGGAADCILPISRLPKENENVWEVDFSDDGPSLAINAALEKQVVQKSYFYALVFPAVIREILTYAFIENNPDELGEWVDDWRQFALALGADVFPALSFEDNEKNVDLLRSWIDSAVKAFVRGKSLTILANQWKDGEE
jgi:hypothetical protein